MLEREDVERFTANKQELQLVAEVLFEDMMASDFNLAAFLVDPRGYTRAFMAGAAGRALQAVLPEAFTLGDKLAEKAGS